MNHALLYEIAVARQTELLAEAEGRRLRHLARSAHPAPPNWSVPAWLRPFWRAVAQRQGQRLQRQGEAPTVQSPLRSCPPGQPC